MTEVWAELSAYEGEFDLEKENCILISSGKNWMEQAAKDQLLAVSRLPGVVKAVGLPDLHPGRIPVGTAVLSRGKGVGTQGPLKQPSGVLQASATWRDRRR